MRPSHGPPRTFTTVRLCVGRYFCGSVAVPTTLRRYFQHVWPIEECGAEDGRVVGHMLHDLVSSKPKDLDHAICEFVDRTAMLRDCGLPHIGDMLVRLLRGDVHGKPGDGTGSISPAPVPPTAVGLDPSALTEEHAVAIGNAIVVSVHDASAPVAGLKTVVKSHAILEVMKSKYAWFVPMLEVLMAPNVASDADAADEESGFSSVVRLVGESALMTPPPSPSPPCYQCTALRLASGALRPGACLLHCQLTGRHATTGVCGCTCERGRRFDAHRAFRSCRRWQCRGTGLGFARLASCPK